MDEEPSTPARPPRQPKPLPPGGSATRFPGLVPPRERLDELRQKHLDLAALTVSVADGALYLPDFVVMAMLQRSYGVVDALIDAVDSYNVHAAAPLLRLQLRHALPSALRRNPGRDGRADDKAAGGRGVPQDQGLRGQEPQRRAAEGSGGGRPSMGPARLR